MFSIVIQLLTLAAFMVHALFGCCGHHEHSACGHAQVCDSSTPHDDSCTHAGADRLIDDLVAAWRGCDHPTQSSTDHSHSCDEGTCAFVMPLPAPQLGLASIMAVVPIDGFHNLSDVALSRINRVAPESRCAFTLVLHRCALQQSWQV